MSPISQEEVDQATKEMTLGKYSGLDGFRTYFFHHCWSLVKEEVWKLVEDSRTYQYVLLMLCQDFVSYLFMFDYLFDQVFLFSLTLSFQLP